MWKFRSWSATTPPRVLVPRPVPHSSWASVLLRRFVHNCASIRTTRSDNSRRTAITARPFRACDALRWYGPFHLSTRESSHDLRMACLTVVPRTDIVSPLAQLLALSGQSDCRHSLAFPKRRPRTCKRATLAALGGLWPCPCMFAPGAEQKRVSHSCHLHVGLGWYSLACTCVPRTRYLSDPNVPLDMENPFLVHVVQCPWNKTIGAPRWAASHGDCERLPRLPSTANSQGRLQCNGPGI